MIEYLYQTMPIDTLTADPYRLSLHYAELILIEKIDNFSHSAPLKTQKSVECLYLILGRDERVSKLSDVCLVLQETNKTSS